MLDVKFLVNKKALYHCDASFNSNTRGDTLHDEELQSNAEAKIQKVPATQDGVTNP
jgi:hypothetical protein